jgi:ribonuclease P protein component
MERKGETYLPAEQARPQAPARFPGADGNCWRSQDHRGTSVARTQASFGLGRRFFQIFPRLRVPEADGCWMSQKCPPVQRLKRRRDFLRAASGDRVHSRAFSLQASPRPEDTEPVLAPARFGITVTKRIGGAVERNRIKRRFKEALRLTPDLPVRAGRDYVIVAKAEALTSGFQVLQSELSNAIRKIDRPARPRLPKAKSAQGKSQNPS